MNIGTPKKDVMIPIGMVTGEIRFIPIKSDTTNNNAPTNPETGTTKLLSPPPIKRVICGATRPTNPIVPVKQIVVEITNDDTISNIALVFSTFTPKLSASSSPELIKFKSFDLIIKNGVHINRIGVINDRVSHVPLDKLPTIQNSTSETSTESAKYCITVMLALNKWENAIPIKIIISGVVLFIFDIDKITMDVSIEKKNALAMI